MVALASCATTAEQRQPPIPTPTEPGHVVSPYDPPQRPEQNCNGPSDPLMVPIQPATAEIPDGISESNVLNTAIQILSRLNIDVESKDVDAHVLVTRELVGQTIAASCRPINFYRSYKIRLAITSRSLWVTMDCRGSDGWEAYGGMPAHREPIQSCNEVSVGDSKTPAEILKTILLGLDISYGTNNPRSAKAHGWWCTSALEVPFSDCTSTKDQCEADRRSVNGTQTQPCQPVATAFCYSKFVPGVGVAELCTETSVECERNYEHDASTDKRATCAPR